MVSLLRKPLGFAFIYAVLSAFLIYFVSFKNLSVMTGTICGLLVLFTLIYILMVKAHLSHHFILWASVFIALLSLVVGLAFVTITDPNVLMDKLKDPHTWINIFVYFAISYLLITIGNWIAGFFFKSKGHI